MRWIIRPDLAASVIAHLTLVALVIVVSKVHPFQAPRAKTVAVEIVTPNELGGELKDKPPEFAPMPQVPDPSERSKAEASDTSSPPPPASPTRHEEAPQPPPSQGEVNAQSTTQSAPSLKPVEPDISVKYGVMLGWPGGLPLFAEDNGNVSDGGGAKETITAGLPATVIAEFRRHLRTCTKLPSSIAPSDYVRIKLRVVLTPDGKLAGPPVPIEGSPSSKGPILVESAKRALAACQPYRMLPADQYREWKVLEIPFTPHDFSAS